MYGEDVVCLNPQSFENFLNSADEKHGPLSDLTSLGMP